MWVLLNDAFLSIVAHRERPGHLLVRGRWRGDVERVFPGFKVAETPHADYRFRAVVPRQVVAEALAVQAEAIGYGNFKASVADAQRHDAYFDVWRTLRARAR